MTKFLTLFALYLMLNTITVAAQEKQADVVVHIDAVEYSNPIHLWHPYYSYWYFQGPVFEDIVTEKFNQAYSEVTMCEATQSGKVLLWLKPKMFFNPQMQMYYGKVTANAYTGIGEHVASYEAESGVWGLIDQQTETRIKQSYALAVDGLIEKMKADAKLQGRIDATAPDTKSASTPCSMITLLPKTRIRAMPF